MSAELFNLEIKDELRRDSFFLHYQTNEHGHRKELEMDDNVVNGIQLPATRSQRGKVGQFGMKHAALSTTFLDCTWSTQLGLGLFG